MEILYCILIGYATGCISPSYILSRIKGMNLREEGTGNLGATNVTMVMGRGWGVFVMLFDIGKGCAVTALCNIFFGEALHVAGLLAGLFAVIGHVFPFYLKFRGGKGLAAFGGMVLGYNPLMFLVLLVSCLALMFMVNYSFIVPFAGGALFCVYATIVTPDIWVFVLSFLAGALIIWKHSANLRKAKNGEDIKVRDYIKKHIFR